MAADNASLIPWWETRTLGGHPVRYTEVDRESPLRPGFAVPPLPKGEARRRAAAVIYETVTPVVDPHLWGSPGRRAAAVNGETENLVGNPHHWVSPGPLWLSSLGQKRCTFRRAGARPRRPRWSPPAAPGSERPKTLPPGGRWLAAGETDEERRNLPKRMQQNKTHPQTKSTPLGSPSGRAGGAAD